MSDVVSMDTGPDIEGQSVGAMTQLIANLQNTADVTTRVQTAKELKTIATALGPERTRTELIPYVMGCLDDEDEVADAICDVLIDFAQYVGGAEYAFVLLPPLEAVAAGEEAATRTKAVSGITSLMVVLPPVAIVKHLLPVVSRLAAGHWYTQRSSACGLMPTLFRVAHAEGKTKILEWLSTLSTDQSAMVRRAVAEALPEMIALVDKASLQGVIHPIFVRLMQDLQDSVRLLAGRLCIDMARVLTEAETSVAVLPQVHKGVKDAAWRVRYVFAEKFTDLQTACGPLISRTDLLPAFVELLGDQESEVRAAAAKQTLNFCLALPADIQVEAVLKGVLPKLQTLVIDEAQHVRCALASIIMGLASIIGKEHTISFLLPLFLQLLKDDFSDVRLNMISNLEAINKVIGIDQLAQALEPAINELLTNENWRVRLATIDLIPLVAKQLGVEYFEAELASKCMDALQDKIFKVRAAAVDVISKLIVEFGPEWAKVSLLPRVMRLAQERNTYISRMVTVMAINRLLDVCSEDLVVMFFVPMITVLHADKVPNIRFNVAKVVAKTLPRLDQATYDGHLKAVVDALAGDADRDVNYYGCKARAAAQARFK